MRQIFVDYLLPHKNIKKQRLFIAPLARADAKALLCPAMSFFLVGIHQFYNFSTIVPSHLVPMTLKVPSPVLPDSRPRKLTLRLGLAREGEVK
jgi:hypothetical protein